MAPDPVEFSDGTQITVVDDNEKTTKRYAGSSTIETFYKKCLNCDEQAPSPPNIIMYRFIGVWTDAADWRHISYRYHCRDCITSRVPVFN
jgi:hypothetical protein